MLLEVAVGDVRGLGAAVEGGADRVELCSALEIGGLTPSAGLMRAAAGLGVPVYAMIRPTGGGFACGEAEVQVMEADIAAAREAGLAGVVFGVLRPAGGDGEMALDMAGMARLMAAAHGPGRRLGVTLHRAFDRVADWRTALDQAAALGVERILTSGQAATVGEGAERLAEIVAHAAGRLVVMPGAGVTVESVPLLRRLGVAEAHASCGGPVAAAAGDLALGFALPGARRTEAGRVRALKAALAG